MRLLIAVAFATSLAGCANSDGVGPRTADSWAVATANPLGPPVSCVAREEISGTTIRDDRAIDFQMRDGGLLRNRLTYACPGLLRSGRFVYRTALDRLCSTDTITLVQPDGSPGASCGLGQFQPIEVPHQQGALPRG